MEHIITKDDTFELVHPDTDGTYIYRLWCAMRLLKWKTFAVQVEALAMVVLQSAGGCGLNAYAITPSFFLSAALGIGSVGAMLKSIASQARPIELTGASKGVQ